MVLGVFAIYGRAGAWPPVGRGRRQRAIPVNEALAVKSIQVFQTALDALVIGGREYVFAVTVILIFDKVPKVFSMLA